MAEPLEPSQLSLLAASVGYPTPSTIVYREECTQCFDSQDSPLGIDVCLACFNGGCVELGHAQTHAHKTGHLLALNIQRTRKLNTNQRGPLEEPLPKKLAISEHVEADEFEIKTSLTFYGSGCDRRNFALPLELPPKISATISAVLASSSSAQMNEVKAWEEEIETCIHVTQLAQDHNPSPAVQASATCHACELSSNLWFCLQCGSLGCGRPQYGGIGGNGHALQHYHSTGHCVNVKLGTITAEGSADLYCYNCDDARTDERLQEHLAHFSIEIAKQEKTEKSMTELQVEHNMKFDFSMSGEDGRDLVPVRGPGLTGLKNLGNSCYVASVLQVLFALGPFRQEYLKAFESHCLSCEATNAAICFDCQMNKIAHGLLSGRYAMSSCTTGQSTHENGAEAENSQLSTFQEGIKPMMFKAFIGKGHPEFSTMRQQDADEFMRYFFQFIQRQSHQARQKGPPSLQPNHLSDPTTPFRFELEQKLQCTSCGCVRYRYEEQDVLSVPVPAVMVHKSPETMAEGPNSSQQTYQPVSLDQCISALTAPQTAEYTCPRCQSKTTALTTSTLASFPRYLVVHARRIAVVNWVPKKLEIPITIKNHEIDLGVYLGSGLQPGEESLPDDAESAAPEPPVDLEMLATLESMGFPTSKCRKAIQAAGDSGVEAAMNWLFEHADDPEEPIPAQHLHSEADVSMLQDMGFTENQAKKALGETGGNVERAVEWLFSHPDDDGSLATLPEVTTATKDGPQFGTRDLPAKYKLKAFISHKGPSVHSGHYIAHVKYNSDGLERRSKAEGGWILFNDEKVARAEQGALSAESLAPWAYIYVFEKTS